MREREFLFSFTRLKNGVLFLRLVFTEDERTVGMAVLGRGRRRAFVSLGLVQQLGQAATAAKVDAEAVEQSAVEELVLLFHWRPEEPGQPDEASTARIYSFI